MANDQFNVKNTIRIEVELEKTGDDSFPEFSYVALLDELNKTAPKNAADQDARHLAAYFDAKYGNFGNTAAFDKNKRKRRERIEDLMDMGEGYDANDEFIDDSDAHDVHVPQEYETWHGGFYVNRGKLRFKMGQDSAEDVNLITGTKKRNLGMRRLSEDESDDDDDDDKPLVNNSNKPSPKKKTTEQKEKSNKPSKEKQTAKEKPKETGPTTPKPEPLKKPTSPGRSSQRSPRSPARLIMEKPSSTPTAQLVSTTPDEADILPSDTPPKLKELCATLRQIAELQKGLSSQKFFTAAINKMLLEIESMIQNVPQKTRSSIYNYLVKPMPCTKDTFISRIKKMKRENCESKLSEPHAKLVILVSRLMGEHERRYQNSKEHYEQKLAEYTTKSTTDPNLKKPRNPARQFNWTVEVKSVFASLMQTKKDLYGIVRPRGITCDEWVHKYIEDEVKGMWPPGWMTQKQLERMYEKCVTDAKSISATTTNSANSSTMPTSNGTSTATAPSTSVSKQTTSASNNTSQTNTKPATSVIDVTAKVAGAKRKLSDSSNRITQAAAAKRSKSNQVQKSNSAVNSAEAQDAMLTALLTQLVTQNKQANSADLLQQFAKQFTPSTTTKSPLKKEPEKKKLSPIQPRAVTTPTTTTKDAQIKTERPDSPDVMIMSVTKAGAKTNITASKNTASSPKKQLPQTTALASSKTKLTQPTKAAKSVHKAHTSPVKSVQPKVLKAASTAVSSLSVASLLDFSGSMNAKSVKQERSNKPLIPKTTITNHPAIATSLAHPAMIIQNNGMATMLQQRQPFSVQQIIAPSTAAVTSSHHLIQTDPKFTGGLNFTQITQQQQHRAQHPQTSQPLLQQQQQSYLQSGMMSSNSLSNDLSMIEPTLPFQPSSQSLDHAAAQQQLFMRQQQVKHNL